MAKFNEYPAKTEPKDADKFMLYSVEDTANKLIDYDKLADAVLDKLTSKQFTLNQGTKTLLSALNELNSNSSRVQSRIQLKWADSVLAPNASTGLMVIIDDDNKFIIPQVNMEPYKG